MKDFRSNSYIPLDLVETVENKCLSKFNTTHVIIAVCLHNRLRAFTFE